MRGFTLAEVLLYLTIVGSVLVAVATMIVTAEQAARTAGVRALIAADHAVIDGELRRLSRQANAVTIETGAPSARIVFGVAEDRNLVRVHGGQLIVGREATASSSALIDSRVTDFDVQVVGGGSLSQLTISVALGRYDGYRWQRTEARFAIPLYAQQI